MAKENNTKKVEPNVKKIAELENSRRGHQI